MKELNGAKMIEAIEKTEMIAEFSVEVITEHSTFSGSFVISLNISHNFITPFQLCFSPVYRGKKAVTFKIIMFPINRAVKHEIIILLF
jgi:hypothetical protein